MVMMVVMKVVINESGKSFDPKARSKSASKVVALDAKTTR
jgi:hypothetical protein